MRSNVVAKYREGYAPILPTVGRPILDAAHCSSCGLRLNAPELAIGENLCDECMIEETAQGAPT